MVKKEYKSGTRKYIIGSDGYKRDRKTVNRIDKEFKKKTYQAFTFRVRKDDTEILEKLNEVDNKQGYIIDLIRQDIKASKD